MHSIELRELETFLALADELHFGRAGQRMGLTQSRVSQSLRDLERKLGAILVERTSRRVALTPAGERFRVDLQRVYEELTEVIERATAHELSGTVHVSLMYPNVGGERLVQIIDAFESSYPGCDVEITTTPTDDAAGPLRRGDVDLLVTTLLRDPPGILVLATLGTEPRMLAVANNHVLAGRREVSLEDLADYKVAAPKNLPDDRQEAWVPFRTPSGRPIERTAQRPPNTAELAMLVARGKVVHPTVLAASPHFGPPNIALVPISDLAPLPVVMLAMSGPMSPQVRAFVRIAENFATPPVREI